MQEVSFEEVLGEILARDPRYHRDAYFFVKDALDYTQKLVNKNTEHATGRVRHVTGQELLGGIRDFALVQFGPMTITVFEEWGVRSCTDFGEIVFNMVESALLAKTEKDTRDDFKSGYDFEEAFRQPFLPASAAKKSEAASA
jgi:uncharacterized repeat protein (TIGR04138 family)